MEKIKTFVAVFLIPFVTAIPKQGLFPFGRDAGDTRLNIGDDVSSNEVYLDTPIAFYDSTYDRVYVNMNGHLTFESEMPRYRDDLIIPFGFKMIAPFFSDVDISLSGNVFYRETEDESLLQKAARNITALYSNAYGFVPYSLFIATWEEVGYYSGKYDRLNTFQVVIASDGIDSYAMFLYPEGGIQWLTADRKYQTNNPDTPGQAGFDAGDRRRSYVLPGSGNQEIQQVTRRSNVNLPGVWLFRIGNTNDGEIEVPNAEGGEPPASSCSTGGSLQCHTEADCKDHQQGYCCQCRSGFYGNGFSCIKNDVPRRVNGKVRGTLNGVYIDSVDLHGYIVMNDGRTFTAISRIPPRLGYAMQTLYVLGDVFGWLYALPLSAKALNGFTITGGEFTRNVLVTFNNGNRVTISQTASGRDPSGYMNMDTELNGDIPNIPNVRLTVKDFTQEFQRFSKGLVRSNSNRFYYVNNTSYRFTVEENITFTECDANPLDDLPVMRLSVSRPFVVYDNSEEIVRHASSNRIGRAEVGDILGGPCKQQGLRCDSNAECAQSGSTYRCSCRRGYQGDGQYCEDIDECQSLTSDCHPELAQCTNTAGSFECRCLPGFVGDGRRCRRDQTCGDSQCHVNARCVFDSDQGVPKCECAPGFYGDGVNVCTRNDVQDCNSMNNCDRNARCILDQRTGTYACVCNRGYLGDGYYCEMDTQSTCDVYNNCDRDAECLYSPELGRYQCMCKPGFSGNGLQCREDNCRVRDICDANARCIPEENTYVCRCNQGYEGDGRTCTVTSVECNTVNNCDPNAECLYEQRAGQYSCRCRQGYEGDGYSCQLIANCLNNREICDANARCQRSGSDFKCVCNPGFRGDGFRCTSVSADGDYLIVNQGMSILQVPLGPSSNNGGKVVLHIPGQLAIGVDVDCYERYIYWTDVVSKIVSRAKMDGTDHSEVLKDLNSPEGVAIDWISRNMYITDSGSDTISVAKLDGSETKVLFRDGLVNPRGIQVDPVRGLMFWTDWNRDAPKIERANMDGTGRMTLVSDGLGLPNGLTIDPQNERVCWADAGTRKLQCVDYEPQRQGRTELIYNQALYPFALANTNGNFYWTDWEMNNLPYIREFADQPEVPLSLPLGGNGKCYGLVAVKDQCPRGTNPCYFNNGGCRFLCLPAPGGRHTCVCPDNIDQDECNRIGLLI